MTRRPGKPPGPASPGEEGRTDLPTPASTDGRRIRTYGEVEHATDSGILEQVLAQRARLAERLAGVGAVVAIASGKGGVGKSAVTANLAVALALRGRRVGVVDADLNGPSLARMLGVSGLPLREGARGIAPVRTDSGVGVVSMDLLQEGDDAPLRWKQPAPESFVWQSTLETGVLREFLSDVEWGDPDFLLVDVPPGTDKIGRLLELAPRLDAVLLVAIPSEASRFVVARSVRQALEAGVARVGLVANMTEHACPSCGHRSALFAGEGVRRLAEGSGLEVWCEVPFDPRLGEVTDRGTPLVAAHPGAPASLALRALAERLEAECFGGGRP